MTNFFHLPEVFPSIARLATPLHPVSSWLACPYFAMLIAGKGNIFTNSAFESGLRGEGTCHQHSTLVRTFLIFFVKNIDLLAIVDEMVTMAKQLD